jgi:diaminopimelate decarboxylase
MAPRSISRRELLKTTGGLLVGFNLFEPFLGLLAQGTPGGGTPLSNAGGLSADQLDSWIAIAQDGTVSVFTSKVDLGTGIGTALGQIVAEELDVPISKINMEIGDTTKSVDQGRTSASRTLERAGPQMRQAAAAGAPVVLDAPDEASLAANAGVERVLVRVTLGVDADTHEAIRTGHHGSKFGLPPDLARTLVADALDRGLDVLGVHVHVGSQLADFDAQAETIVRLASFAARCRDELGWVARVADLGGGFGIRHHPSDDVPESAGLAASAATTARTAFAEAGLPTPDVWLEPGRSLVGPAGVTLYRVGSVKRLPGRTWVAVDGGMSDNPRPQLYDARYTAVSATRPDEPPDEVVSVAGMHCESGDVLIDDVALPAPRRGDLLAVPATGAYTLAMASNYNGVTRPAAVLVRDGTATVIRRRETIDDLLRHEAR